MAESGRFLYSIDQGCDEVFDYECTPCSRKNKNVEATNFCQQCQHYLCKSCIDLHSDLFGQNHHKMTEQKDFCKITSQKKAPRLTEPCMDHPGEILSVYCPDHDMVACTVCAAIDHKQCSDVGYIPTIAKGFSENEEIKQVKIDMNALQKDLSKLKHARHQDKARHAHGKTNLVKTLQDFRKRANKIFDALEKKALDTAENHIQDLNGNIKDDIDSCDKIVAELQQIEKQLNAIKPDDDVQNFVHTKKGKQCLDKGKQHADKMSAVVGHKNLKFRLDSSIESNLNSLESMGDFQTGSIRDKQNSGIQTSPQVVNTTTPRNKAGPNQNIKNTGNQTHQQVYATPTEKDKAGSLPKAKMIQTGPIKDKQNPGNPTPQEVLTTPTENNKARPILDMQNPANQTPQSESQNPANQTSQQELITQTQNNKAGPILDTVMQNLGNQTSESESENINAATSNRLYSATKLNDFDMKTVDNKIFCDILGVCQLSDGRIVLADSDNKKLKLLDSNYRVKQEIPVSGDLEGVCTTGPQEVAVCVRNGRVGSVQFVSMASLSPTSSFKLNNRIGVNQIAYNAGEVFIGDYSTIRAYNKQGRLLRTVYNSSGILDLCNDGIKIYVSEWNKGLVILDKQGHMIWRFSDQELHHGLCVDGAGNVFVCKANNVIQLDMNGQQLGVVLTKVHGLKCLCYDRIKNRLIVAFPSSDTISVFDMRQ